MFRLLAVGLVAAVAATGLQAGLRFGLGTPLAPEEMAQALFAWVPMPLFAAAIGLLGFAARWVAFAAMVVLYLAAGAAAAPVVVRTGRRAAPAWIVGSGVLQALVLNGRGAPARGPGAALAAYLAACALYVGVCLAAAGRTRRSGGRAPGPGTAPRRGAFRHAAG